MKYKLTDNIKTIDGITVYQIEALKDFWDVKKGDLGGWIESERNLSQENSCWVYENAKVFGYAEVFGNAKVFDNAKVYENAKVFGNAKVFDEARVYENAKVFGYAKVYRDANVFGNARVYEYATVYGDACVYRNGVVSESQYLSHGDCITDISKNMKESIRCQTGLGVFNNEVIVYKQVRKDLSSFYDEEFVYKVGEIVEVENPDMSNESCASGLHGSHMNYWNDAENIEFGTFLAIKVQLEDVITVQVGKIRFKKGLVLGTYDIESKGEEKC